MHSSFTLEAAELVHKRCSFPLHSHPNPRAGAWSASVALATVLDYWIAAL